MASTPATVAVIFALLVLAHFLLTRTGVVRSPLDWLFGEQHHGHDYYDDVGEGDYDEYEDYGEL
jgi:hypothetical protein